MTFRGKISIILIALALPLSGCGVLVVGGAVGKATVGAGKLAVKGTVGAVKVTGRAVGTVVDKVAP